LGVGVSVLRFGNLGIGVSGLGFGGLGQTYNDFETDAVGIAVRDSLRPFLSENYFRTPTTTLFKSLSNTETKHYTQKTTK
jgi:hypothetical protein